VVDLLQLMLFPRMSSRRGSKGLEILNATMSGVPQQMTDREIVAQSMTFLLAGYETSSAVMAFLARMLAEHPEVQSRLQDEIDSMVGKVRIVLLHYR
jgi:cytochrome P450